MSPVGTPDKPYVENPDFVPSPIAMRGTLETTHTGGEAFMNYDAVVPVFEIARERDKDSPTVDNEPVAQVEPEVAPAPVPDEDDKTVPASGAPDQTILTETTDTTGTTDEPQDAPLVVPNPDAEDRVPGGDDTEGAGTDSAETQGTADTTGTDEGTIPAEDAEAKAEAEQYQDDPEFTPEGRTVDAVNKYLETASPAERERVLGIEREGRARTGILEGPHGG